MEIVVASAPSRSLTSLLHIGRHAHPIGLAPRADGHDAVGRPLDGALQVVADDRGRLGHAVALAVLGVARLRRTHAYARAHDVAAFRAEVVHFLLSGQPAEPWELLVDWLGPSTDNLMNCGDATRALQQAKWKHLESGWIYRRVPTD